MAYTGASEPCPKVKGYVTPDECNRCDDLGLSRWSMMPICRYEEKRKEARKDGGQKRSAAPRRTAHTKSL